MKYATMRYLLPTVSTTKVCRWDREISNHRRPIGKGPAAGALFEDQIAKSLGAGFDRRGRGPRLKPDAGHDPLQANGPGLFRLGNLGGHLRQRNGDFGGPGSIL